MSGDDGAAAARPPWWRTALRWGERVLWAGVLVFLAIRLAPQFSALTGIGPALGSAPEIRFITLAGDPEACSVIRGDATAGWLEAVLIKRGATPTESRDLVADHL